MDDLEDRLRRFRPVGPPADLRMRIVSAVAPPTASRLRAWWPSVGAAAAAIVFYALAADVRGEIGPSPAELHRRAAVDSISRELGGDAEARALAEHIVLLQERLDQDASEGSSAKGMPDE